MKPKLAGLAILLFTQIAVAQTKSAAIAPDRVTIYRVPLVCPAVPQIGCGSHAKPILLEFEREPTVTEAWLNHSGTLLALVWASDATGRQRSAVLKRVTKTEGLETKELTGPDREEALKQFFSGAGWLRGKDVDHLSEQEAAILAQRLVRKIRSLVSLTDPQAKTLLEQSIRIITRRLTGELSDRSSAQNEILGILREELSEQDLNRLQEVLKDYRPGSDAP